MNAELLVDGRHMAPPEPLEKVLAALALRRPGQTVRLLIHCQPHPLYELLDAQHVPHATRALGDGNFEVTIG